MYRGNSRGGFQRGGGELSFSDLYCDLIVQFQPEEVVEVAGADSNRGIWGLRILS